MVALNPDYAPSKTLERSKNRVGDFFSEGADCVGLNRPASRMGTREKVGCGYETASGRPVWTSADPAGFPMGRTGTFMRRCRRWGWIRWGCLITSFLVELLQIIRQLMMR